MRPTTSRLTELEKDLKKVESTPNYSYISPDLCNAGVERAVRRQGRPSGAASADAFLAQLVPKILASPAYKKDGLLIVTFGQAQPARSRCGEPPPRPTR